MNKICLVTCTVIAALNLPSFCEPEAIPFPLDGATTLRWNRLEPLSSSNLYGIIEGDILDSFPVSHLSDMGICLWSESAEDIRFSALGEAGSEFGDPLLNKLDDPALANRDHYTLQEYSVKLPRLPVRLFSGNRYVDHHSDRFDTLWNVYGARTGKRMKYDYKGLTHGSSGGYSLNTDRVKAWGFVDTYGSWGATPFFFSPIRRNGIRINQHIEYRTEDHIYSGKIVRDRYNRFYDHQNPCEYTDWLISGHSHHSLSGSSFGTLELSYNSSVTPETRFGAALGDSLPNIRWLLHGAVYNNGRPELSASAEWKTVNNFFFNGKGAWEYHPRPKEFTFYEHDDPVHYRTADFHRRMVFLQAGYRPSFSLPVQIAGWYRYSDREPFEIIETHAESTVIFYDTLTDICHHFSGLSAGFDYTRGRFFARWHADAGFRLEDAHTRFHLPWRSFVELGYGSPQLNWFYTTIRYELRSKGNLSFYDKNTNEIYDKRSPAQDDLSLNLMIPFLLPIVRDYVRSRVWISAQSIRLFSAEKRLRIHPNGNLIGPRLRVAFDMAIR